MCDSGQCGKSINNDAYCLVCRASNEKLSYCHDTLTLVSVSCTIQQLSPEMTI